MAIRVIKEGRPPDTTLRGTCHACKSEVEADREGLEVKLDFREGGYFAKLTCPVCKQDMHVYGH